MEFFNKTDYKVLECLIAKNCMSPVASLTIKQIIEFTELSQTKIRSVINQFKLMSYIKDGSKEGNNKTYYITNEGVEHFKVAFNFNDDEIEEIKEI